MTAPQAYGNDRMIVAPDGVLMLACRYEKGWIARKPRDLVHAAFPGTCVRWNDQLFEVISIEMLEVGIRYRLQPWEEHHVVRVVENYDEASEQRRAEERRQARKRASFRTVSPALALLIGNLPAEVQERLESEYGVAASRLTLIALIPWLVIGTFSVIFLTASFFGAPLNLDVSKEVPVVPIPLLFAGSYFLLESLVRMDFALRQSRPLGSIVGVIPWFAYAALTGQVGRQPARLDITPEPSVFQRDAYTIREPLLAFLPPPEQMLLQQRYGFNPVRWGWRTCAFLLVFATAGMASSIASMFEQIDFGNVASLFTAGYLFAEQIARLQRIRQGQPAGSILGVLVRPLTGKLLEEV